MGNLSDLEFQASVDDTLTPEMQTIDTAVDDSVTDETETMQALDDTDSSDVFVFDGDAASYGWGVTEDGEGVVVWSDSGYEVLYGCKTLRFNDMDVSLENGDGEYQDVAGANQHLEGRTDSDTFVVEGLSSDYGYGPTEDGEGIVIWDAEGNYDLLYGFEAIRFSDTTVNLAEQPCSYTDDGSDTSGDPVTDGETDPSTDPATDPSTDDGSDPWADEVLDPLRDPDGDVVADDPSETQTLHGSPDLVDRFVFDASADDYAWEPNDDGGWMVWNVNDDSYDMLYDYDQLQFNDFLDDIA
jgi:hypothetical protein